MFHWYRKASALFAAALLLLLAACGTSTGAASGTRPGTPTVATSGARFNGALVTTQSTSTPQTSSLISLTVQPYPTPFTVYEVGSAMSHVVATGTDELGP